MILVTKSFIFLFFQQKHLFFSDTYFYLQLILFTFYLTIKFVFRTAEVT